MFDDFNIMIDSLFANFFINVLQRTKLITQRLIFLILESIGIHGIETQTIGGMQVKLYAISFEKDRMRLKVPVFKAKASGLRKLTSDGRLKDALKTLQGRARIRRTMWSRRAQEYETKINSGDPVSIAEVLRDLKRSNDDTEQSYSERQIYQSALQRLAREVAAVQKITEIQATEKLEGMLGTATTGKAAQTIG